MTHENTTPADPSATEVIFMIPGEPKGKGRPRFARVGNYVKTYTPEATAVYENLIKICYQKEHGPRFAREKQLKLSVWIYMKIPESASEKKKRQMMAGEIRPTKRPDADNVLKAILDGLNDVAYHDDAQIVDVDVHRYYSITPHCVVVIAEAGGPIW